MPSCTPVGKAATVVVGAIKKLKESFTVTLPLFPSRKTWCAQAVAIVGLAEIVATLVAVFIVLPSNLIVRLEFAEATPVILIFPPTAILPTGQLTVLTR
jgi:zinc transporter ZupT